MSPMGCEGGWDVPVRCFVRVDVLTHPNAEEIDRVPNPYWWLVRVWAAPYTALGAIIGLIGVATGGRVQRHSGVLEFHGGATTRFLDGLPLPRVLAITLGHTVIGRSQSALDVTRCHERVHVRQFERWGPMMGPAYLGCSVYLWMRGQDPYRSNPFEREAFELVAKDERPNPPDPGSRH